MSKSGKTITPLQAARVNLRPLDGADCDAQYLGWLGDPVVIEHIDARYFPQTAKSISEFVEGFDQENALIWRISDKESNDAVGNVQCRINPLHKTADIGIMLGNRAYWGKGIGSEVLRCVIHHLLGDRKVEKITMATRSSNDRMLKTIRKLGFCEEGILRNHVRHGEGRTDIIQFGLFEGDLIEDQT
ncbi:MAG: GNAT family N-acetyltransferase [Kordiimonadaceae bacterium]|nr:GNAT family N-acetyltransferase [Kordiimonadaceae bacterium]